MYQNSNLKNRRCKPCEGKTKPLDNGQISLYLKDVSSWEFDEKQSLLRRDFSFSDFISAINFVNDIAHLAEEEGHHPDIHIHFSRVTCELSTHSIKGLSENDFIMAAKIDEAFEGFQDLEN